MKKNYKHYITIADILIEVQSNLNEVELGFNDEFKQFLCTSNETVSVVKVKYIVSEKNFIPKGDLVFDPGSIWKVYKNGNIFYTTIEYPTDEYIGFPQVMLKSNDKWDRITIFEHRITLWNTLLNYGAGELIFRTRMLFTDGVVVHAAGIDDNGRGIIFVGHSGVGKSTQLKLWDNEDGVIQMNDDRIALRISSQGVMAYGTPWYGTGQVANNHKAPLKSIFLLEQSPVNEICALLPSEATSLLLSCTFLPYWNNRLLKLACSNLDRILSSVPVYLLRCRPELSVIPLVRSVL